MSELNIYLLHQFIKARDSFISGNSLAQKLGISRVSIWSHLEKLRTEGFDFDAIRNKGYRLKVVPEYIHPELVQAYLFEDKNASDITFVYHSSIDSTQSEVERILASGKPVPIVAITRQMTQGRGRRGRSWNSLDMGNIYTSFGFRPQVSPQKMHCFTLWMGLHLCDFLEGKLGLGFKMKWPNDLMISGKKCGGMLTEAKLDSDHIRELVLGVGINVNTDTRQWPEDLLTKATSLKTVANNPVKLNELAAQIISTVLLSYKTFLSQYNEATLNMLWDKYNYLENAAIIAHKENGQLEGTVQGIDETGRLIIRQACGKETQLDSGDVSIKY